MNLPDFCECEHALDEHDDNQSCTIGGCDCEHYEWNGGYGYPV